MAARANVRAAQPSGPSTTCPLSPFLAQLLSLFTPRPKHSLQGMARGPAHPHFRAKAPYRTDLPGAPEVSYKGRVAEVPGGPAPHSGTGSGVRIGRSARAISRDPRRERASHREVSRGALEACRSQTRALGTLEMTRDRAGRTDLAPEWMSALRFRPKARRRSPWRTMAVP